MNLWVVAFPCLMLLGSFGTYSSPTIPAAAARANIVNIALGIVTLVYQGSGVTNAVWGAFVSHPTTPYLSVSIPLNVLLTMMIVARLVLHSKNIRAAMGAPAGIGGLYKTTITVLVESSALYAVSSLLVIWDAGSRIAYIFLPILAETQVRAFPRPGSSNRLSNMTTDWTGHRPATHHQTSRQPERVDGQHYRHASDRFIHV